MSKLREHDFGAFDRVDAPVIANPEPPCVRTSREGPNVALRPSTPGVFSHELEGGSEPALDLPNQLPELPLRTGRELDFEVGQPIASKAEFISNVGPGPARFALQPPQVFKEELLGRVGVEEIVEELVVADSTDLVTSKSLQGSPSNREGRVFTRLGGHWSHELHGSHHTYS